eukprot:CAMPEP_0196720648 /NCGR_PEP_ID=MMETSP1091-20130531/3398_1 /TAXON_ID=302021 /ORGANISM="Rhodomonas sp., Strain CCMP768" /LENGTH=123 /DNA_ID=CAMNT_0042061947 /DNA_START=63 /DNA_END=434 /DNA_ORIENTATION=+
MSVTIGQQAVELFGVVHLHGAVTADQQRQLSNQIKHATTRAAGLEQSLPQSARAQENTPAELSNALSGKIAVELARLAQAERVVSKHQVPKHAAMTSPAEARAGTGAYVWSVLHCPPRTRAKL